MLVKSKILGRSLCATFFKESKPSRDRIANGRVRKGTSVVTTCVIRELGPNGSVWCGGQSKQNMRDKYDHVVGKRIAMTRALQYPPFCDNRELREEFWKEFQQSFVSEAAAK